MEKTLQTETPVVINNYLRSGGCSLGCGACCQYLVLPLDKRLLNNTTERLDDFIYWAKLHGIEITNDGDWLAARIPLPCKELDQETLLCKLYGTPERPDICNRYPRSPADILNIKDCTYEFEIINDS
mgnify:CR=1 FL=1